MKTILTSVMVITAIFWFLGKLADEIYDQFDK